MKKLFLFLLLHKSILELILKSNIYEHKKLNQANHCRTEQLSLVSFRLSFIRLKVLFVNLKMMFVSFKFWFVCLKESFVS